MAKSIKNRLNGSMPEFIQYVENYGIWAGIEKYGLKDYIATRKALESETGNPNFGVHHKISTNSGRDLGTQVVEAFADFVLRNEAKVKSQQERIEILEYQLNQERLKNEEKSVEILDMLRTNA